MSSIAAVPLRFLPQANTSEYEKMRGGLSFFEVIAIASLGQDPRRDWREDYGFRDQGPIVSSSVLSDQTFGCPLGLEEEWSVSYSDCSRSTLSS